MKLSEFLNYKNSPDYSCGNQLQQLQNKIAAQQQAAQSLRISYQQLLAQANVGFHKEGALPEEGRPYKDTKENLLYEMLAFAMEKENGSIYSLSGQTTIAQIEAELQYRKNDAKVKQEKNMLIHRPDGIVEVKAGQKWEVYWNNGTSFNTWLILGVSGNKCSMRLIATTDKEQELNRILPDQLVTNFSESNYRLVTKENKMKEILKDLGQFLKEHRTVIYTVALIALVDHFILGGKFRDKLKELAEKALTKAHKQLDDKIGQ